MAIKYAFKDSHNGSCIYHNDLKINLSYCNNKPQSSLYPSPRWSNTTTVQPHTTDYPNMILYPIVLQQAIPSHPSQSPPLL